MLDTRRSLKYSPPSPAPPRRRLGYVVAALIVVVFGAASYANWGYLRVRCEDGMLTAHRGLPLPTGERALSHDEFPPIPVPQERCRDENFATKRRLKARWLELTSARIDEAMEAEDPREMASAADALDRMGAESGEALAKRRRALALALLRAEIGRARDSVARARARLQEAREAGVDETTLEELERSLAEAVPSVPRGGPAVPAPRVGPAVPADPNPDDPTPAETSAAGRKL